MTGRDSAPLTDADLTEAGRPARSTLFSVIELMLQALALGAVLCFALAMPFLAERLVG